MLVVSRCFVPRTTKGARISTLHLKTFCVIFLGKYNINLLRSKLISIRFMFPSHWSHHYCYLCCSRCALKTKLCDNVLSLVGENAFRLPGSWAFYVHESSSTSVSIIPPTLCTPTSMGQIEQFGVLAADAIDYVDRCGWQTISTLMLVIPDE